MNLVLGLTGGSGSYTAKAIMEKSQWPVTLIASKMGRLVYEHEVGPFSELENLADQIWQDTDLSATVSSGSVPTGGMIITPCSSNTLGKVSAGIADSLVSRAAHCHLKERRKVVLCVREAPWSVVTAQNAANISLSGGIVMPISPPYYMGKGRKMNEIKVSEMLEFYADHVLSLFGQSADQTWEEVRKWGK
tara:strand:- start:294 stop:866 length:573 start_codon:yes stop_codon:yes gene_type:complete